MKPRHLAILEIFVNRAKLLAKIALLGSIFCRDMKFMALYVRIVLWICNFKW
jgi:hypothetical protein